MIILIAHIRRSDLAEQSLAEHCRNVAVLCERAGHNMGFPKTLYLIGLMHDMGKATEKFQKYLHSVNDGGRVSSPHNHSPAGAVYAYRRWGGDKDGSRIKRGAAQIISMCILGHHSGLTDCIEIDGSSSDYIVAMNKEPESFDGVKKWFFENVCSETELDCLFGEATDELEAFEKKLAGVTTGGNVCEFDRGFLARVLLSALVDADRWDSACFEYGEDSMEIKKAPNWNELLSVFEKYREEILASADKMGQIRATVSDECFEKGASPTGIYTLCVPTGGGKTFSSLRFALRHAAIHNKSRIFYIIPYNTILDQNAQDIRTALSDYPSIMEHHSNVVLENESEQLDYRRLTERWDSDIILTSLVQFMNSCFYASNTDARRLYRLSDAVLIFDEIQSLPKQCKTLFERAVLFLSQFCNTTVVLCTATQPRLEFDSGTVPLIENSAQLFSEMKRVDYIPELSESLTNDEAASRIAGILGEKSVLSVVNTKAVAIDIFEKTMQALKESGVDVVTPCPDMNDSEITELAKTSGAVLCIHLSTFLCPAHRKYLIKYMKLWLKEKARVFCASTALIEAGVNISFPVVVRSNTWLPGIIQAAGRANRSMEYGKGTVYIWRLSEEKLQMLPDIMYGGDITMKMISCNTDGGEFDSPQRIADYFREENNYTREHKDFPLKRQSAITLYSLLSGNDKARNAAINFKHYNESGRLFLKQSFRTANKHFYVIPENTVSVLVPYGEGEEIAEQLFGENTMSQHGFLLRKAQAYCVSVFRPVFENLQKQGAVSAVSDTGLFVLQPGYYDENGGLTLERKEIEALIL